MSSEAFVTLATTDGYALGALVLAESIRQVGTKRNLVVLISNHLSDLIRKSLEISFDEVILVDELNSNDIEHLNLLSRPELGITFTKINCWLLEQYSKCVFLDADCVVLRSIDDLFQREEFSAAPDAGWPDCFNSGVFVYRPSKETFQQLMGFASQQSVSFDGGDQGLLNGFFSNWRSGDISRHLPFTYNVTANAFYSYLPAVTRFRNDIHLVHFAGALKPWQLTFNPQNEQLSGNLTGHSDIQRDFLLAWWRIMHQRVWPNINQLNQQSNANNKTNNGEGQFGNSSTDLLSYGNLTDNQGIQLGSAAHRRAWEAGHIDYFGRDSFENIQQQLQRNIQINSYQSQPSQQRQTSTDQTTTGINKTALKETTPPLSLTTNHTPTTHLHQNGINLTTTTKVSEHLSKQSTSLPNNTTKSALKAGTPVPQQQPTTSHVSDNVSKQAATNVSQSVLNLPTKTTVAGSTSEHLSKEPTSLPTNTMKSALKGATPVPQEQPTTSHVSGNLSKQSTTNVSQNVPNLSTKATTNVSEHLSKESTSLSTNTMKSALKGATPIPQEQPTTSHVSGNLPKQATANVSQSVLNLPTKTTVAASTSKHLSKEPTSLSTNTTKSALKGATSVPQEQPTTSHGSESVSKQATTNVSQSVLNLPTKSTVTATGNGSDYLSKESPSFPSTTLKSPLKLATPVPEEQPTPIISQHVTHLGTRSYVSENVSKESSNPLKSALKESRDTSDESPTKVAQSILKDSRPFSMNLQKSSSKETTTTTYSPREHPQTPTGLIRLNENQTPPLAEHETNWTVKSTIVTAYTQGSGEMVGPTVVSKVVSESSATSSNDDPMKTSMKQITDPTKSSGLNIPAKTSSDHFTWLLNKFFVAITYTISLCYLLFLVAIRREKKTDIIHGKGTSVRDVTSSTNHGNRVNK